MSPEVTDLNPTVAVARKVAFVIATAEDKLGLTATGIPLLSRLEQIMQTAMERPATIDPALYEIAFWLHASVDAA